jgi:hypothetical protein
MASPDRSILQLKVVLCGSRPPIWRRVLVPSTVTLDRFHHILQTVMGWTDSHLHEFRTGEGRYGTPDPDWDEDDEVAPERRTRLGQLLQRPKDRSACARPRAWRFGEGPGQVDGGRQAQRIGRIRQIGPI